MKSVPSFTRCALTCSTLFLPSLLACGGNSSQPSPQTANNGTSPNTVSSLAPASSSSLPAAQASAVSSAPTLPRLASQTNLEALPQPLMMPEKATCTFETSKWKDGLLKLRIAFGGESFANITKPKSVRMILPTGKAQDAFVEVDAGIATVRGWVDASVLSFYPKEALNIKDSVTLAPHAHVKWEGGSLDKFKYSFEMNAASISLADTGLTDEKPCSSFGIEQADFDIAQALGSPLRSKAAIRPGSYTLTKDVAGAEKAAILTSKPDLPYAYVIARTGTRTRIAWSTSPNIFVFGWMDTDKLADRNETVKTGEWKTEEMPVTYSERNTHVPNWKRYTCESNTPLIGEIAGSKVIVGHIKQGKSFEAGPDIQGYTGVSLPGSDLLTSDLGKLWVDTSRLKGCASE